MPPAGAPGRPRSGLPAAFAHNGTPGEARGGNVIYYPYSLYAQPYVPALPPPLLILGATRRQEIYFNSISEARPAANTLWLSGTGYATFDDRTAYQFSGIVIEVTLQSADAIFMQDCLVNVQNPLPPGAQLVIAGIGSYGNQQVAPDRSLSSFIITQPVQCAVSPQVVTPPPGNYGNL